MRHLKQFGSVGTWSWLPLISCWLAAVTGCSGQAGSLSRVAAEGRVTVNGKPLAYGSILFTGAHGPRAGGIIRDGQYSLDSTQGPPPCGLMVAIRAPRLPVDIKLPEDPGDFLRLAMHCDELLPAEYNTSSTLRVTATTKGPNHFDFDLQAPSL